MSDGQYAGETGGGADSDTEDTHMDPVYTAAAAASLSEAAALDNLVKLDNLTEESILETIAARYEEDIIYTYVGDMLLATNPFKHLPIYSERHKSIFHPNRPVPPQPHVFAVAQKAFKNLSQLHQNQCCLISGESGAGKTETAKLFLNQLLNFDGSSASILERRIMESQPLLEAFGNAKTMLNDNSSRFGKFVEIFFSRNRVCGASIERYLLEKSRLVGQRDGENNFHIFYYLLTGAPEEIRRGLGLFDEKFYNYLHTGGHLIETESREAERSRKRMSSKYDMPGAAKVSDVQKYEELLETLSVLEFEDIEVSELHALLAAVLLLGNVDFNDSDEDGLGEATVSKGVPLRQFSLLFRVRSSEVSQLLTTSRMKTRGEAIVKKLNCRQARANRDSMAKSIYEALFTWLVKKLNRRLRPHRDLGECFEIGVLDIFGFENFTVNGFEQLCINTTNEQLQYFFNQHIFQWEIEEYKTEGIQVQGITFNDNLDQVQILLGKPLGIFSLLDEECRLRDGSDSSCMSKLIKHFGKQRSFVRDKLRPDTFGVLHYAGLINYSIEGIVDRNKDSYINGFKDLVEESESYLVRALFEPPEESVVKSPLSSRRVAQSFRYASGKHKKARTAHTVGATFRASLGTLMLKLESATPHYIRCIKPNMAQLAEVLEKPIIIQQLRYTGVMETTRIRSQGFAVRVKFADFIDQYKIIRYKFCENVKSNGYHCAEILTAADLDGWQIGNSKVFMKYYHRTQLVELMKKFSDCATTIALAFRSYQARQRVAQRRIERALQLEKQSNTVAEAEQQRLRDEVALAKDDYERMDAIANKDDGSGSTVDPLMTAEDAAKGYIEGADLVHVAEESESEASAYDEGAPVDVDRVMPLSSKDNTNIKIVKGSDPKAEKQGTLTKGDVGARLAMFQNVIDTHGPRGSQQGTLTRGVNVGIAAKSFKLDVHKMMPLKSFKAGPAMPPVMPWMKKKKNPLWPTHYRIDEEDEDENAGIHTLLRRREDLTSFLAELSLSRLYAELVLEVGIDNPKDFFKFSVSELIDFGFQPQHIAQIFEALKS